MRVDRREFLASFFAGSAASGIGLTGLRYFELAAVAAPSAPDEKVFRTGHSNNCDGACGHEVRVVNGRVTFVGPASWEKTTIDGQAAQDFSPRICLRGISQMQNTYSPDRIKYPYRRVGERGSGEFERISWDEAATTIATKFQEIQAKFGKPAVWIAPYSGSLSLIEGDPGVAGRFAGVIGASLGDGMADNQGDSAGPSAFNYLLFDPNDPANNGGALDGHEYTDFANAKVLFLWANNLAETAIPDWRYISAARARGDLKKLVVIDPRYTPTAAAADVWAPIRPGTDSALIDGMINWMIKNKHYNEDYLLKYTVAPFLINPKTKAFLRQADVHPELKDDAARAKYMVFDADDKTVKPFDSPDLKTASLAGTYQIDGATAATTAFQALVAAIEPYTPEHVAEITEIDAKLVVRLAELYAENSPAAIKCGFGLSHWYRGDLTHQALLTMATLAGNIGVSGGGVTIFSGGLTSNAFSNLGNWLTPDDLKPSSLMPMDACAAMLDGKPYPVRAAWFTIDNWAQQMSDRNRVLKALGSLDFIVVSDYNFSATAEMADIILPSCTYFEKTDLLSSANYYLQYMPKIIEPLWESKSELDAFAMVANKMGVGKYFTQSPDEIIAEVLAFGDPKAPDSVKGATLEQVKSGAYHLNVPTPYVPFADKKFATKSGRIEFYVEALLPYDQELCGYKEPIEAIPSNPLFKRFPLVFLSTHTRFRTHSQFANLPWLKEINNQGQGFLEINPTDAARRGIGDGDVVRIFNDRGSMKVRARLTEAIKPGVTNCYQGGWATRRVKHYLEGHPNNLTHQIANPAQSIVPTFSSNAAYYDCLVEVESSTEGANHA
jgi:molybdopterin-containing oxidoreductase family molybdopterin binding subunit